MVTHDPLAASYAHSALFLEDGQVVGRLDRADAATHRRHDERARAMMMMRLSRQTVRHSWRPYVGAFVALAFGVALLDDRDHRRHRRSTRTGHRAGLTAEERAAARRPGRAVRDHVGGRAVHGDLRGRQHLRLRGRLPAPRSSACSGWSAPRRARCAGWSSGESARGRRAGRGRGRLPARHRAPRRRSSRCCESTGLLTASTSTCPTPWLAWAIAGACGRRGRAARQPGAPPSGPPGSRPSPRFQEAGVGAAPAERRGSCVIGVVCLGGAWPRSCSPSALEPALRAGDRAS